MFDICTLYHDQLPLICITEAMIMRILNLVDEWMSYNKQPFNKCNKTQLVHDVNTQIWPDISQSKDEANNQEPILIQSSTIPDPRYDM